MTICIMYSSFTTPEKYCSPKGQCRKKGLRQRMLAHRKAVKPTASDVPEAANRQLHRCFSLVPSSPSRSSVSPVLILVHTGFAICVARNAPEVSFGACATEPSQQQFWPCPLCRRERDRCWLERKARRMVPCVHPRGGCCCSSKAR